jgi:chorismate synthase
MIEQIKIHKKNGDTIGGQITAFARGVRAGWGEPVFDKLHACLAKAMLSINAAHSFKYGFDGVDISSSKGSQVNDIFEKESGETKTNYSGGIQGGISNGNDIYCEIDFKPVSTIMKDQYSSNDKGSVTLIKGKGRHDPCVVPRAVPIVESMMALTLVDHYLRSQTNKI